MDVRVDRHAVTRRDWQSRACNWWSADSQGSHFTGGTVAMVGTRRNNPDGRRGRHASPGRWGGFALAVVVAGWSLGQPGVAAGAATAGVTWQYTCAIGAPMTARVEWQLPPRIVVRRP